MLHLTRRFYKYLLQREWEVCVNGRCDAKPGGALTAIEGPHNGWVVGLEGRSTLSLCSERALNLAPARSRAQT